MSNIISAATIAPQIRAYKLDPMVFTTTKHISVHLFVLLALLQLSGCSNLGVETQPTSTEENKTSTSDLTLNTDNPSGDPPQMAGEAQEQDIWQRLRTGFKLSPSRLPSAVTKQQKQYLKNPKFVDKIFARTEPYLFHVVEQLDAAELPLELALLPIVESAYDPFAYSHSHAVGLWQFIPSTGKSLGLHKNRWYDGRRDVLKSTQAAVEYLTYLNKRFNGEWLHTLAAYNSGEGTVKKAIRKNKQRGKPTDFWSLKLPRETRNYVPRLLALADIVSNPKSYNLELPQIPNAAFFDTVQVTSQIELSKIIEVTGVEENLFINLNPAYRRSVTPPEGNYQILLPIDKSLKLEYFLSNNEPSTWAPYREYVVKSGDTLSQIAQRYQLPTSLIKNNNGIKGHFLKVGQVLLIPPSGDGTVSSGSTKHQIINYRVVSGDTLSDIAQRFKTSVRNLKRFNGLSNSTIKVGQVLSIHTPNTNATATPQKLRKLSYRVRRGDSLYLIAEKFDLTIREITRWNKLDRNKYLQPGQRLTLYINPMRI